MKRFVFALLLSLMLVLAGCGMNQSIDSNGVAISTKHRIPPIYHPTIATCAEAAQKVRYPHIGCKTTSLFSA